MDQEMMQLKHELKEFVEHGQHILQKMEGSMGQRYYGMRGGQSGGYSGSGYGGGQGGSYGNREPWMQGGYPQQEQWPNVDPRWFM
jgi:uncharacterized membrane protein YgcG